MCPTWAAQTCDLHLGMDEQRLAVVRPWLRCHGKFQWLFVWRVQGLGIADPKPPKQPIPELSRLSCCFLPTSDILTYFLLLRAGLGLWCCLGLFTRPRGVQNKQGRNLESTPPPPPAPLETLKCPSNHLTMQDASLFFARPPSTLTLMLQSSAFSRSLSIATTRPCGLATPRTVAMRVPGCPGGTQAFTICRSRRPEA